MKQKESVRPQPYPREVPTRQVAIILFVIVGLLVALYLAAPRVWQWLGVETAPTQTPVEQTMMSLPEGWTEQPAEDERILYQVVKQNSTQEIMPSVTVLYSLKESDVSADEYTAQLVEAAEAGLSQLRYDQNSFDSQDNVAVRRLEGQYLQGDQPVGLKQQIYVQGDDVFTFTGIFTPETTDSAEVEMIFDQILANLLQL